MRPRLQQILDSYPSLRAALQPEPLPRVSGSWRYSPEEDFANHVAVVNAGKFYFRATVTTSDDLSVFHGYGGCLAPFLQEGDLQHFDSQRQPNDGDFVLVGWGEQGYARVMETAAAAWRERFGEDPGPIATKRLRRFGNDWLLATATGLFPLADNRVLGVLCRLKRGATFLYDSPAALMIATNSVTGTAVTTEPADGSQFYAAATQPVIESVGLNGLASYTSPAGVATQVDVSWTAQARISNTTSGTAVGQARLRARVFVNSVEVYSSHLILESFTGGSDHWGAFAGTRSFAVPAGQTIDAYIQTDRSFSTGGASPSQTMYWRNALVNLVPSKR